jgi:molybdate transport system ATP-binding protein
VAAIAGLQPVDSGQISLGGTVLDDPADGVFVPPEERRIGVVFQDYLLFSRMSVLDNVSFGLRSNRVPRAEATAKAHGWLTRLGLRGLEGKRPGELSGGQAQRVALARALITEPDLLLLDEPLAALDVSIRAELRHALSEHLAAFEGPRLLITHDPTEAFLLGDRIHVIEGGVVTQAGTADDIRMRPRSRYAADLAGSNLLTGVAGSGVVDTGVVKLKIADDLEGPVLATIHPTAISVHTVPPEGSQRNNWETTVERVERLGTRVRLRTGQPLPLTVEVTAGSQAELHLEPGARIWLAIKATEITVEPDVT